MKKDNANINEIIQNFRVFLQTTDKYNLQASTIHTYTTNIKHLLINEDEIGMSCININLDNEYIKQKYQSLLETYFQNKSIKSPKEKAAAHISQLKAFQFFLKNHTLYQSSGGIDDIDEFIIKTELEGKIHNKFIKTYEGVTDLREVAIKIHGATCMVCGFNFEQTYGKLGKNFIEVHHLIPLDTSDKKTQTTSEMNLACVCSNCHKMLHRKPDTILSLDELKNIIKENKK